jgi:metal-responsive CopG/Arc/MetJ family transcriptional regulator
MGMGPTFTEPSLNVPLIVPRGLLERINEAAARLQMNRSAYIRSVVEQALMAQDTAGGRNKSQAAKTGDTRDE